MKWLVGKQNLNFYVTVHGKTGMKTAAQPPSKSLFLFFRERLRFYLSRVKCPPPPYHEEMLCPFFLSGF